MVVGENGVLNRAQNATTETAKAQAKEALSMAISGLQGTFANDIANGTNQTFIAFLKTKTATDVNGQMNGYTVDTWGKTEPADANNIITVVMHAGTASTPNWTFYVKQSGSIGATVSETN